MDNPLLQKADRKTCEMLAAQDSSLNAQRAAALLLLDQGATYIEAARATSLSRDQVRYASRRFKAVGMNLFAEGQISSVGKPETAPQKQPEVQDQIGSANLSLEETLAEDIGRIVKKKKKKGKKHKKEKKKEKKEKKKNKKK